MGSTFSSLYIHLVFGTKNRERWISRVIEERVWAYLAGISSRNGMTPIQIGGVEDHVHAMLCVPPVLSVSSAVHFLKGGSAHWVHGEFPNLRAAGWQDGYGVFSVSRSAVDEVAEYIRNQREHHRVRTFAEEYRIFLSKHGLADNARG